MKKVLIYIFIILVLAACGKKKEEVQVKEKPRSVRYLVAENKTSEFKRIFAGNIISETESNLSFRVSGTIIKKYSKLGDYVEKGQILAELDNEDYKLDVENAAAQYDSSRAKLAEANAQMKSAKASLINSKNEYARIEKLYFDDNVSKSQYDSSKADRDVTESNLAQFEAYKKSAQSNLKASEMQLAQSKLKLSYTKLIAPENGFITAEEKEENETVSSGTPVYKISLGEKLQTETFIPETIISLIKKGQKVDVEISALTGKVYKGEIKEIGTSSEGYGNTFPVKIELLEKDENIKPGMSSKIGFDFGQNSDARLVIPISALDQNPAGEKYVYTVKEIKDGVGKVIKSVVTIGEITSEGVEILSGIKSGDYIITSGVTQITEGQEVSVSSREEN
ncbi:efflux RND transporter periplasmic adaptor subunit [Ilyobacter polytropus]|uniref:Efflux transporter, RND family, MFP subunit n=1 Tax=Ilyobacter polytropus (strain ATCC 51220 / DSM 2926 / LMG 16218 / CuHBu1) TaxID=572544 RepID=E3H8M5_ILYPC|nr:efflux RND transporter periplasmic adaptor subunit [Ilyobacter polytropus]ADO83007.1 efflux transporter, RND family, MFP subunit [Ilyobacter polytropus DSM 2926]